MSDRRTINGITYDPLTYEPLDGNLDESPEGYLDIHTEEEYHREFSESLKESFPRNANYDSVTALLIYWSSDDLGCESEVLELEKLLDKSFRYFTIVLKLPRKDPDMVLRGRVNSLVASLNADGKRNLLIVYYGGHGKPDDPRRGSVWCAHDSLDSPSLQWDEIQPQLERADGDVVLIIDSCHAAQAARDGKSHKIELLAASAMNVRTPRAGDGSFTAALIAEMKRLLESHKGGFSVSQLESHLIRRPAGLQETPVYCDLSGNTQPSIILQPIPRPGESRKGSTLLPRASVTFKVSLLKPLDTDHVHRIARWLKNAPPNTVLDIDVVKINDKTFGDSSSGSAPDSVSPPRENQYNGEDSFDDESESESEDEFEDVFEDKEEPELIEHEVEHTREGYYEGPWEMGKRK